MTTRTDADVVATMRRRVPWLLLAGAVTLFLLGGWIVMLVGMGASLLLGGGLAWYHKSITPGVACSRCSVSCAASTGLEAECSCGCEAHR